MLAYVFWHWPDPSVGLQIYSKNLISFHETLAAHKPRGFHHSTVFLINRATWLDTTGSVFEEWYLLENSAAMDSLNEAAVTGACEEPHNNVARQAAGGIGGLYRLRLGAGDLLGKQIAFRFSKPKGVAYPGFIESIAKTAASGSALWQRQMTLGPTAEFCFLASSATEVPPQIETSGVPLQLIWSGE